MPKQENKESMHCPRVVAKYEDAAPITVRMRNTPAQAREAKKEKEAERNKQQVLRRIRRKIAVKQDTSETTQKNFSGTGHDTRCPECCSLLSPPAVRTTNVK